VANDSTANRRGAAMSFKHGPGHSGNG
jgi:hypothetical protein